jgi:trk system potassium uptake protein TrkA
MESIIVGGGKVGYNLLKTLKERGYDVTLVERSRNVCSRIAEELDTEVFCGDGTDLEVLSDAGLNGAEVIAAVTGTDEENLVICQIAKIYDQNKTTIARVNNPKNIEMFKALGINRIVCSTEVIAGLIESELEKEEYHIIQTFERGSAVLVELPVNSQSPWNGSRIKDLVLPEECVITSVVRDDRVIYPKGDTSIHEGDKVLFITNRPALMELIDSIYGRRGKNAAKKR